MTYLNAKKKKKHFTQLFKLPPPFHYKNSLSDIKGLDVFNNYVHRSHNTGL